MPISEILAVAAVGDDVNLLFIDYEEGDIGAAIGGVYRTPRDRSQPHKPEQHLATNDTLRELWASPSGHLWVASADGYVGTTAPVSWPATADVTYETVSGPTWQATALPRLPDGLRPDIAVLGGTGDDNVFAGTYGGHLYRWDGHAWHLVRDAGRDSRETLLCIGGTGPDDLYAGGTGRLLLHWNGRAVTPMTVPGAPANENVSGIVALDDGTVLLSVSGNAGRFLQGTAATGFSELCSTPLQPIGMARVGDRIFLATDGGAGELVGRDAQVIRASFKTSSVFRARAMCISSNRRRPSRRSSSTTCLPTRRGRGAAPATELSPIRQSSACEPVPVAVDGGPIVRPKPMRHTASSSRPCPYPRPYAPKGGPMPKPLANLDELEFDDVEENGFYTSRRARFSAGIGARKLGYNLTELPAGKAQCPFHSHRAEEEMFCILEGQGELRFGDQRYPIRKGDVIACPTGGPEVAHQIINTGTVTMRYLSVSNLAEIEVCEYPDSRKVGVWADAPAASRVSLMVRQEGSLDYYDGERTEPWPGPA